VSVGPYRNYQAGAGTKNQPDTFFVPLQKKGPKIDPHVSNLGSREFLFQVVQVHPSDLWFGVQSLGFAPSPFLSHRGKK